MVIGGCPQICHHIWPRSLTVPILLIFWFSLDGTGWAQGGLGNCPTWSFRAAWETQVASCLRKVRIFMPPCSVLPLFCAVARLVCEACVQAAGISYPPGPTALPRVCQAHAVMCPVGCSKCCAFPHSAEPLISNMMHALCIFLFLTAKLLNPFHVCRNNLS